MADVVNVGTHAAGLLFVAADDATGAIGRNLPPTVPLGPAVAQFDQKLGIVSLDLNSTIPEYGFPGEEPSNLQKADFGPLSIGVLLANGGITPLGEIGYDEYGMTAYETSAGIVDLPISLSGPVPQGALVIQSQNQIALQEQIFSAQTDSRGIYLDQGDQTTFDIAVYESGIPSPGANVIVARYGPSYQLPQNFGDLSIVPTGPTAPAGPTGATAPPAPAEQVVDFTNGTVTTVNTGGVTTEITTVTADGTGVATVGLAAQTPGFMVLGFFPYAAGGTAAPPVAPALNPQGPTGPPPYNTTINNWYYTTVRVLPFDDALPQQFCDLWNNTHDQDQAWNFIYLPTSPGGGILYLYDMVFSVMLEHLPLGNRTAVENAITSIWTMISPNSASEGSFVMPITRDLSAGKRLTLQLWIYLVANGYPTSPPLTVDSINGWSPIT